MLIYARTRIHYQNIGKPPTLHFIQRNKNRLAEHQTILLFQAASIRCITCLTTLRDNPSRPVIFASTHLPRLLRQ